MQSPQLLNGDALLFAVGQLGVNAWNRAQIVVQSLKTGQRRTPSTAEPTRATSHGPSRLCARRRAFAVPFNLRRLEVTGGPVPVVEAVRRASVAGAAHSWVFGHRVVGVRAWTGDQRRHQPRSRMDREGWRPHVSESAAGTVQTPRISPEGRRVAVGDIDNSGPNISIVNLSGASQMTRLTFGGKNTSA